MLTGKATSIDSAHPSGQFFLTSTNVAELIINMASDIAPEEGSFSSAARAMKQTQATLSRQGAK